MKLISCHIDNFGTLSNLDREFVPGENVIMEDNGSGKSTFAAFLRVMFFGFEGGLKRDVLDNERKRFQPWQGGAYGGRVTFEAGGKTYEATRKFGETEKKDVFELRDAKTNLICDDFSERLGEELFKMDRQSFSRTIFVGQMEIETKTTDDINSHIGNVADVQNDMNHFNAAMKTLEDLANRMSATRKTGSISKRKDKISEIEAELRSYDAVLNSMEQAKIRMEDADRKRTELDAQIRENSDDQQKLADDTVRRAHVRQEQELSQKLDAAMKKEQELRAALPAKIPEVEEIAHQDELARRLSGATRSVREHAVTEEQEARWNTLHALFEEHPVTQEQIRAYSEESTTLVQTKAGLGSKNLTEEENERLKILHELFANDSEENTPKQARNLLHQIEVDRVSQQRAYDDLKRSHQDVSSVRAQKTDIEQQMKAYEKQLKGIDEYEKNLVPKESNLKHYLIKGVLCLIILGYVAWHFIQKYIETQEANYRVIIHIQDVFVPAVAIILIIFVLVYVSNPEREEEPDKVGPPPETMRKSFEDRLAALNRDLENKRAIVAEKDEVVLRWKNKSEEEMTQLKSYLRVHGVEKEFESEETGEIQAELDELENGYNEYRRLSLKQAEFPEEDLKTASSRMDDIRTFLNDYHLPMQDDTSVATRLHELSQMLSEYEKLSEQKRDYERALREQKDLQTTIRAFFDEYEIAGVSNLQEYSFDDLRDQVQGYRRAQGDSANAKRELDTFRAQNAEKLSAPEIDLVPGLTREELLQRRASLEAEKEEASKLFSAYREELAKKAEQLDEMDEMRIKLAELTEEQSAEKIKLEGIRNAKIYLEKAKAEVVSRYSAPILESFEKNMRFIDPENHASYRIDTNMQVTVNAEGLQRDSELFSAGYRDLMGFCLRLAFIDAVFTEEKPMLILDDPFTNLDDEKLKKARDLVREIASEYQVLYFTCSASRK